MANGADRNARGDPAEALAFARSRCDAQPTSDRSRFTNWHTIYEGRLLPKRFWDQVIHCDAGPNIVRAYPVEQTGAGYAAREEMVLEGTRDKWFRPADVCVGPDGSLFVTDWSCV